LKPRMEKYQHIVRAVSKLSGERDFWRAVAEDLKRPRRKRRVVNLYELNRATSPNDKAGGAPVYLEDFIKTNPDVSGFKIIG